MLVVDWLNRFKQRRFLSSRARRRPNRVTPAEPGIEKLEDRILLTHPELMMPPVSFDVNTGLLQLRVLSGTGQEFSVTAEPDTGELLVNGAVVDLGHFNVFPPIVRVVNADEVRSISGTGGSGADTFDLSGVTKAAFTNLESVRVIGYRGDDLIIGSEFDDYLMGSGGRDTLRGGLGNDTLLGGGGHDSLSGGQFDDILKGESGNDTLRGGSGENTLKGGGGDDVLFGSPIPLDIQTIGGEGGESFQHDNTTNRIRGNRGRDTIFHPGFSDLVRYDDLDLTVVENGYRVFLGEEDVMSDRVVTFDLGTGHLELFASPDSTAPEEFSVSVDPDSGQLLVSGEPLMIVYLTPPNCSGNVCTTVLQIPPLPTPMAPYLVRLISVTGGPGGDTIDLSGVRREDFINLRSVSVNGGAGDDLIIGSQFNDWLNGGAGHDTLFGGGGRDTLLGGGGDDRLLGGFGNDILDGQGGNDTIRGQGGADTILNWQSADRVILGRSDQSVTTHGDKLLSVVSYFNFRNGHLQVVVSPEILGGQEISFDLIGLIGAEPGSSRVLVNGSELVATRLSQPSDDGIDTGGIEFAEVQAQDVRSISVVGGLGGDTIDLSAVTTEAFTNLQSVVVDGGRGEDMIIGSEFDDWLNGGGRADTLYGGDGDDTLLGGGGRDRLLGGDGDDTLLGGDGRDLLDGQAGADEIQGQAGADTILNLQSADHVILDSRDKLVNTQDDETASVDVDFNFETGHLEVVVTGGHEGGAEISVSSDPDSGRLLINQEPFNVIEPLDVLGVVIFPVYADDVRLIQVTDGPGGDTIDLSGVTLTTFVNLQSVQVDGGDGNDHIIGSEFDDLLDGGRGNDTLVGGLGNDTLLGGSGADVLDGYSGFSFDVPAPEANHILGQGGRDLFLWPQQYDDVDNDWRDQVFVSGERNPAWQNAMHAFHGPDGVGEDGPMSKLGFELTLLFFEQQHFGRTGNFAETHNLLVTDGVVRVDVTATSGDSSALQMDLESMGIDVDNGIRHFEIRNINFGQLIGFGQMTALVPIDVLDQLVGLDSLAAAKPAVVLFRPLPIWFPGPFPLPLPILIQS